MVAGTGIEPAIFLAYETSVEPFHQPAAFKVADSLRWLGEGLDRGLTLGKTLTHWHRERESNSQHPALEAGALPG